jgi:predicted ester cyclase
VASDGDLGAVVRDFFELALNGRQLDRIGDYCAEDYVYHPSSSPGEEIRGLAGFRAMIESGYDSFPDMHTDVLDVVVSGDRAVVRFNEGGTHVAPFLGVAATGRVARWDGIAIYRGAEGKLAEEWSVSDMLSALTQIGAVIPSGEPPE